ncbi:hypothetical protein DYB30_011879, partial [Aphanomyces astaci]
MCCAPAFPVGYCQVFVSFNDQQYTKCSFPCRQSSFLYFQAPAISHVSPVCSPSHVGSTVLIRGIELVDTGTIQLRFTYADDRDGRHVTQIVPGKLNQDGAIVCQTPVLKVSQSMVYSRLDLSLNGCEYTDVGRPFYFYSQHKLTKVEPSGMALELPTSQRLYLSPEIVSDGIQLRLHVSYRMSPSEPVTMSVLGPVDATQLSVGSQYYFAPVTHRMAPLSGFTTGGTVVTLTIHDSMVAIYYASVQANHTIPFMFGNVSACGNLCDSVITCVAPPLPAGHHAVHMAFNQQSFQPVQIDGHPVYFEAFPPPQVAPPDAAHASVQFGPTCGGTPLEIQGHGFVATASDSVTLVQFWFSHESNVVVPGTVVNAHVVTCVTPRVDRVGRAVVLVSCNGQQFSDAPHHLTFEFHAPTVLSLSVACPHSGSLRGGTAIQFHVVSGLPQDLSHVDAVVNVVERSMIRTTPAAFDRSSRTLSFITPAWPYPAHVAFDLSLNKGTFFVPTCMSFLYYSPPPPIRGICPAAGPVGGRTWVEVECPGVVDTGEVTFKLTPIQSSDEDQDILQPPVVLVVKANFRNNGTSDYGAPIQVQFTPWGNPNLAVIVSGSVLCDSNNNKTIECLLTQGSLEAGYCRVELSLNGQQFSATEYPDPRHVSPLHVVYRRLLFPFRVFVPPFFVATTFGSAGGGSRVLICGGHKLVKYVTRGDGKCHVQLTPVRLLGQMTAKLPDKVMVAAQ